MVREITVVPDFTPGFVEVGGRIPKFQYSRSLRQELNEGSLTQERCLDLLKCMLFIRNLEEMIRELRENRGKYGPIKFLYGGAAHLSIGQEAVSTGAVAAIRQDDCITSSHRGHGDSLAKGYFAIKAMDRPELVELIAQDEKICSYLGLKTNLKNHEELVEEALKLHLFRAIAELFGKEAGYCRGRGGGMHIADFSKGHLGANAIVGGSLGMAVGAGLASRVLEDNSVVICFAGDGAFNNGIAHEAMNMATMAQFTNGLMNKKFGVPTIFAVVNNQYGMTGQQRGEVTGIEFLAERGFGYNKDGMHTEIVNGMDVLAVYDATAKAVELTRQGKGPVLLEFWCSRYKGHSLSDRLDTAEDETYRTLKELEEWQKIDPLKTFSHKLMKEKILSETKFKVLNDPELTAYIDKVGQRIARVCDRQNLEYHFKILDDPMVNAFACPGGFIYVTTGILKTIESEAELAGILGHEVGHVTARHAVKKIQGMLAYTILASLLLKDEDARQIIDVVFNLILLGYSREDEFQVDRLGTRYAYEADYDPRGLRDFLAELKKLEKREPLAIETLISSHPPTLQRIKKIDHQVQEFSNLSGKNRYRTEFLEATRRLRSATPLLFQDDFSQEGNWAESGYAYYENGEYHISGGNEGYLSWHGQIFSDFTCKVKVRKIGGSNDGGYYLMFRFLDSENTYLFGLRGDGHYSIWKLASGDAFPLQEWTDSSYLNQENTVNYLQIRCEGSKISVYVNNYCLASVNDNTFRQGKIGFFVSPRIHVAYDDIMVHE